VNYDAPNVVFTKLLYRDKFICVEPGSASYFIGLESGATWSGGQTITVL
jgi:hypothetical protein